MPIPSKIKSLLPYLIPGVVGIVLFYIGYNNIEETGISNTARWLLLIGSLLFLLSGMIYFLKRKWIIPFNLLCILFLIIALEAFCFIMIGMPSQYDREFKVYQFPDEHIINHIVNVPAPNDSIWDSKVLNGDTVYHQLYRMDEYSRRINSRPDSAKEYALFFGCSIGFGHGVEDDSTLAAQYQWECDDVASYNYAHRGQGMSHMLARFDYHDLRPQVKEQNGKAYYIFFWDHIYRSIGSMSRFLDWLYNAPYYTMEDGSLVRKKTFLSGREDLNRLYLKLSKLAVVQYFQLDFPLFLREEHYELAAEMVLQSKVKYEQQFGNDEFYLVIHPSHQHFKDHEMAAFKSALAKRKIEVIDLFQLVDYNEDYSLKGDAHPNPKCYRVVAKKLCETVAN